MKENEKTNKKNHKKNPGVRRCILKLKQNLNFLEIHLLVHVHQCSFDNCLHKNQEVFTVMLRLTCILSASTDRCNIFIRILYLKTNSGLNRIG